MSETKPASTSEEPIEDKGDATVTLTTTVNSTEQSTTETSATSDSASVVVKTDNDSGADATSTATTADSTPATNEDKFVKASAGESAVGGEKAQEEEEVTEGDWQIIHMVNLKPVEANTGEDCEDCSWESRAKLYRWVNKEWKERALGTAKLLKNKDTGKIRFLIRQEKTLKVQANHFLVQTSNLCTPTYNSGSDKIIVWSALDCSEDESKVYQFALRMPSVEVAKEFKEVFEKSCAENASLFKDEINKVRSR